MSRTFEDRINNVKKWVRIHNHYWHKYEGEMRDHADHWDETFHAQTEQDHQDWIDIIDDLYTEFPEVFDDNPRYKNIFEDTREMSQRIVHGEPVVKKRRSKYNLPVFRAWMTIMDILNDISGNPTKKYAKPGSPRIKESPGIQRQRAKNNKIAAKAAMFQSLFEIQPRSTE